MTLKTLGTHIALRLNTVLVGIIIVVMGIINPGWVYDKLEKVARKNDWGKK